MEILNKAQVDELFQREAVFLFGSDAVPVFRVAELFGEDAASYAKNYKPGKYWNTVGLVMLDYLTYCGFQVAASFHNVQQLRKETQA